MQEPFTPEISPCDLHNDNSLQRRRVSSVWHGTESVSYIGPKMWDLVPTEKKNLNPSTLSNSKSKGRSLNNIHVGYGKYFLGRLL